MPRALSATLVAVAVALALGVAWYDLSRARTELLRARTTVQEIVARPTTLQSAPERAQVLDRLRVARARIESSRRRVAGSAPIALTRVVPGLNRQRDGLVALIADAGRGVGVGEALMRSIDSSAGRTDVRDGAIPVQGLGELGSDLQAAGRSLRSLVRSPAGLWGELGEARRSFNQVATDGSHRLLQGSDALTAARTFLGAEGNRRYLLAFQNNAEMRDQGMVLSYGFARATGGRVTVERTGHISDLRLDRPAPTAIPPGTAKVFGFISPTGLWQSVNATADAAWSGRAMADMALQATKQPVDGVISIDVPALARVLRVTGPLEIAGLPEPLSGDNVSRVLLHDLYEGLPPDQRATAKVGRQAEITGAVIQRLTTSRHDAVALGRELGEAAAGGHLRLWSADPREQEIFERTGLGGGPATRSPDRTFHVAVENRSANKVDYYVHHRMRQQVRINPKGDAVIFTTVTIDNQAPVGAAPSYQLGPDAFTERPGDYLGWLLFWGPAGSDQAGSTPESGLNLHEQTIPVPAGEHREIRVATIIPRAVRDGVLRLRHVPQPRLQPPQLVVELEAPGWRLEDPPRWEGVLDRTREISWRLRR